jgi:hypothetical protein
LMTSRFGSAFIPFHTIEYSREKSSRLKQARYPPKH